MEHMAARDKLAKPSITCLHVAQVEVVKTVIQGKHLG